MSDSYPPPPGTPDQPEQSGQAPPPPPPPPGWGNQPGYGAPATPPGYAAPAYSTPPPNNLVWGILTTVLCCLPFGIVSIVYAAKVDGLYSSGRVAEAYAASNSARKWAIVSALVSVGIVFLYGIILVIAVMAENSSGY